METYLYKDLNLNIHGSFTYNNLKVGAGHMPFDW
jgi:hypothetical protein